MEDKMFDFLTNILAKEGFSGTIGLITAVFFCIYMIRSWVTPFLEKLNTIAKKKDVKDVDEDLTNGFRQINEAQTSLHHEIADKLKTIENMINILEHSSRTNNMEIDDIRKDVDKIKNLLDGYMYFQRGNK